MPQRYSLRVESHLCHSVVTDLLTDAQVVIDCGANAGGFAVWVRENSAAKVYSFEPDPGIFSRLPKIEGVEFIEKAVAGDSGSLELAIGENSCSSVVYREHSHQKTVRVSKISLDEFCQERSIDRIDLLKLDIEGAELEVLEGMSEQLLSRCVQITVEFHDFLNQADVPRIRGIFGRLRRLGFFGICFSQHTWGDCLFLNRRFVKISPLSQLGIQVNGKYLPGIGRVVQKIAHRLRLRR